MSLTSHRKGVDLFMTHEEYRSYLQSPDWQKRKAERIRVDGGVCQMCLSAPATEVHHLNYYNMGDESIMTDLVSVCHPCHMKIHNLMTRATAVNPDGSYRYGWKNTLPEIVTRDLEERGLM